MSLATKQCSLEWGERHCTQDRTSFSVESFHSQMLTRGERAVVGWHEKGWLSSVAKERQRQRSFRVPTPPYLALDLRRIAVGLQLGLLLRAESLLVRSNNDLSEIATEERRQTHRIHVGTRPL